MKSTKEKNMGNIVNDIPTDIPIRKKPLYRVVLVGKPNVGKSLLFNKLTGKEFSIVHSHRGVTRDTLNAALKHDGQVMMISDIAGLDESFYLLDKKIIKLTAQNTKTSKVAKITNSTKIVKKAEPNLEDEISLKIKQTLDNTDLIVMVVDIKDITTEDYQLREFITKFNIPIVFCINKVDRRIDEQFLGESFELLGKDAENAVEVSAKNNLNVMSLKERIFQVRKRLVSDSVEIRNQELLEKDYDLTLSVVGRPNAGKSSLLNALLQKDRSVVSETQGTTRDLVEDYINIGSFRIKIIDTAGLRKKSKVKKGLENFANQKSIHAVNQSNVTILVVDASIGITDQDKKIISFSIKKRKSLLLVLNKWDLVQTKGGSWKDLGNLDMQEYYRELIDLEPMLKGLPMIRISCLTRNNFSQVKNELKRLIDRQSIKFSTSDLNKKLQTAMNRKAPPQVNVGSGMKSFKIYYAVQSHTAPPRIVLYVNNSKWINKSYHAYLQNFLEDQYQLQGVPLKIEYVDKAE